MVWFVSVLGIALVWSLSKIAPGSEDTSADTSVASPPAQVAATQAPERPPSLPAPMRPAIPESQSVPAALVQALSDPEAPVRSKALANLPAMRLEAAALLPLLAACLSDSDPRIRAEAIIQMGKLGMRAAEAVPLLKRILEEDPDETVRERAKDALHNIRGYDFPFTTVPRD